jgi:thymidylate kinase
MPLYFGTGGGRPSLLLAPLKLMIPLARGVLRTRPTGASHGRVTARPPGLVYSLLLALWATALAAEKRLKLVAAHRGASRGLVVIADRFPQDQIATYNDGPLLPRLRGVPGILRRFEARAYALARQLPPDLVIKLDATPEVLAVREPDMDSALIHTRVAAVRQLAFPHSRVVTVDATRPLAEVVAAVRREVWDLL